MTESQQRSDPSQDPFAIQRSLDAIFMPKRVAVIGATDRPHSVGRTLLWNLISNPFGGTVYPINPQRSSVLGIRAYPRMADLPEPVDLAIIATPAATVPGLVRDCVECDVPGGIIISAGFKEMGPQGAELERQILEESRKGRIRIVGPNCLGVMNPRSGVNATFAGTTARPGNVAFISQSGALCTAILDWSLRENVGFSAFVSLGSMLDIAWGDLIQYLGDDPQTHAIVLYMESIGDARHFLSAAREIALSKPIIVLKAGRTEQAAKAAASHTGALAGSDDVLAAAFRRAGVLRVDQIEDLFNMAEVLGKQPRPKGPRLTIVTNAGGAGVLATDALVSGGGEMTTLAPETIDKLNEFLPEHWSHGNPIDILGDADSNRYAQSLSVAASDPNSDGLLVILTPQDMTDPTRTAEELKPFARSLRKPVLASWMGGAAVAAGENILNQAGIPTFTYADSAVKTFLYMWRHSYNIRGLYETPTLTDAATDPRSARARALKLLEPIRASGRTLLTEIESKQLLAAYGLPFVPTELARSADEAVTLSEQFGYPVVLKLYSETVTHKTDVGGVQLNLRDAGAVRKAYKLIEEGVTKAAGSEHFLGVSVQPMVRTNGYEVIVGSTLDPQFGPVLLFGSGGALVEVYRDRAVALPPLNTTLAQRMIEQTMIARAFEGVRGRAPVDIEALRAFLVTFSRMIGELAVIKECDFNPLLVSPEGVVALDARVILHPPELKEDQLPRLAIRPYPLQYVKPFTLRDGQEVLIRPIRPEDEPLLVKYHETLSDQSVRYRYFGPMKLSRRVAHERLVRVCFNDYDREIALVVFRKGDEDTQDEILGIGRLSRIPSTNVAEFSMLISDPWQRHGLGSELLGRIIQIGREEGLSRIQADILRENIGMQRVSEKSGFTLKPEDEGTVRATLQLG